MLDPEALRMVDAMRQDSHQAMIRQATHELGNLRQTITRLDQDRTKQLPRASFVSASMVELDAYLLQVAAALRRIERHIEQGHTI